MIYVARRPLNTRGVDIQVIGETIEKLKKQYDGAAVPAAYVDAVRPPDHPAHESLPFDEVEALAEASLRRIAAGFCQWIVVEKQNYPNVSVTLVSTSEGKRIRGFMSVQQVRRRAPTRQESILAYLKDIRGIVENHAWLTELLPILDVVAQIESELSDASDETDAA